MRSNLATVLAFLFFAAPPVSSSQGRSKPAFEVATVKRNTAIEGRSRQGDQPGGRFVATRVTLRTLMGFAYRGVYGPLGGPAWVDSELWDIAAKAPEGSVPGCTGPPDMDKPDTMALMVQSLLEDRFQLKTHSEQREIPVYELRIARGGAKIKLSDDQTPAGPPSGPPQPGTIPRGAMKMLRGDVEGLAVPISGLVGTLSLQAGRKVIDKTGLTGLYDFKLLWTPDPTAAPAQPGTPVGTAPIPGDPGGPSLFTSVQEQLGLTLQPAKANVDALIIDSVQKPSEN